MGHETPRSAKIFSSLNKLAPLAEIIQQLHLTWLYALGFFYIACSWLRKCWAILSSTALVYL